MKFTQLLLGSGKSVLRAWMKSFFAVLIVPILLNFIAYAISVSQLEQEITGMNLSFYRNSQETVDEDLLNYQRLAANIGNLEVFSGDILRGDDEVYAKLKEHLTGYHIDLKDCYRSYLYLGHTNTVITMSKIFDGDEFFSSHYSEIDLSYRDWSDWIRTSYSDQYLYSCGRNSDKRYVSIRYQLGGVLNKAYFVVVLDDSFFFDRLKHAPFVGEVEAEILLGEDELIATTNPLAPIQNEALKQMAGKHSGVVRQRVNGQDYIITYIESSLNQWKYIYMTPRARYLRSLNPVAYIQLAVLIAALLLGGMLIVKLVRKHYAPIKQFIDLLPDVRSDGSENEYEEIEGAIRSAMQSKTEAMDAISAHQESLQNSLLVDLLRGAAVDQSQFAKLELHFPHTKFFVLTFLLNEYKLLFIDEKEVPDEEKYSLMCVILKNILGELLDNAGCWYRFLDLGGGPVCLVNLDGGDDVVREAVEQTRKKIEEYFYVSFGAALSRCCEDAAQFAEVYAQSAAALDYLRLNDEAATVCYDELRYGEAGIPAVTTQDMEDIVRCLQDGRMTEGIELIHILLGRYTGGERYAPATYRYLLYDICAGLIRCFRDDIEEEWIAELYPADRTITAADLEAFIQKLSEKKSGDVGKEQGKENKEQLAAEIRRYLNMHYTESDLNVSKTADAFGYVLSYVSRVFKEAEGIGVVDYINQLRIEDTKKLLCATRQSLQEIAEQVGFNNVATLIRVFKKYEGMTPNNYKKSLLDGTKGKRAIREEEEQS